MQKRRADDQSPVNIYNNDPIVIQDGFYIVRKQELMLLLEFFNSNVNLPKLTQGGKAEFLFKRQYLALTYYVLLTDKPEQFFVERFMAVFAEPSSAEAQYLFSQFESLLQDESYQQLETLKKAILEISSRYPYWAAKFCALNMDGISIEYQAWYRRVSVLSQFTIEQTIDFSSDKNFGNLCERLLRFELLGCEQAVQDSLQELPIKEKLEVLEKLTLALESLGKADRGAIYRNKAFIARMAIAQDPSAEFSEQELANNSVLLLRACSSWQANFNIAQSQHFYLGFCSADYFLGLFKQEYAPKNPAITNIVYPWFNAYVRNFYFSELSPLVISQAELLEMSETEQLAGLTFCFAAAQLFGDTSFAKKISARMLHLHCMLAFPADGHDASDMSRKELAHCFNMGEFRALGVEVVSFCSRLLVNYFKTLDPALSATYADIAAEQFGLSSKKQVTHPKQAVTEPSMLHQRRSNRRLRTSNKALKSLKLFIDKPTNPPTNTRDSSSIELQVKQYKELLLTLGINLPYVYYHQASRSMVYKPNIEGEFDLIPAYERLIGLLVRYNTLDQTDVAKQIALCCQVFADYFYCFMPTSSLSEIFIAEAAFHGFEIHVRPQIFELVLQEFLLENPFSRIHWCRVPDLCRADATFMERFISSIKAKADTLFSKAEAITVDSLLMLLQVSSPSSDWPVPAKQAVLELLENNNCRAALLSVVNGPSANYPAELKKLAVNHIHRKEQEHKKRSSFSQMQLFRDLSVLAEKASAIDKRHTYSLHQFSRAFVLALGLDLDGWSNRLPPKMFESNKSTNAEQVQQKACVELDHFNQWIKLFSQEAPLNADKKLMDAMHDFVSVVKDWIPMEYLVSYHARLATYRELQPPKEHRRAVASLINRRQQSEIPSLCPPAKNAPIGVQRVFLLA